MVKLSLVMFILTASNQLSSCTFDLFLSMCSGQRARPESLYPGQENNNIGRHVCWWICQVSKTISLSVHRNFSMFCVKILCSNSNCYLPFQALVLSVLIPSLLLFTPLLLPTSPLLSPLSLLLPFLSFPHFLQLLISQILYLKLFHSGTYA